MPRRDDEGRHAQAGDEPAVEQADEAAAAIMMSSTPMGPQPCWMSCAPTTLVSAMVDPTDRSMPPLTMISVMPSAPMATMTVCVKMILKLL